MKPIIGITASINKLDYETMGQSVVMSPKNYLDAVNNSGGVGIIIPENENVDDIFRILDGLIIAGGRDISPSLYGQYENKKTSDTHLRQDQWELDLINGAIVRNTPLLCICRGHQLLCVSRGGSLHQHLPETIGFENHGAADGKWSNHKVILDENSEIGAILGNEVIVNSGHHQGVMDCGDLRIVGRSEDGLIEAVELESQSFLISTQWHPEMIKQHSIFDSLIKSARI